LAGLTPGAIYVVSRVEEGDFSPIHLDDDGYERNRGPEEYELVVDADELAELRAFKETALAAGYVPPEPPKLETDEEAAERFREEWWNDIHDDVEDAILAAIAWARANPR
jgi:hypothetical protein